MVLFLFNAFASLERRGSNRVNYIIYLWESEKLFGGNDGGWVMIRINRKINVASRPLLRRTTSTAGFVQAKRRHSIGTFTLHCYAYANACVRSVTRRAFTASLLLESFEAVYVSRSSRFSSPLTPINILPLSKREKFVFRKRSFLCL